jgi:hypothetical protein
MYPFLYPSSISVALVVSESPERLEHHTGGNTIFSYSKPKHSGFSVLNFPVDDIEEAVDELTGWKSVSSITAYLSSRLTGERASGIFRGPGPVSAWFKALPKRSLRR